MNRIITLTTDFGLKDPFVGIMKGVILSIHDEVNIIDISHGINSHDIFEGAIIIKEVHPFFPPDTIHVVVVDPGVGGSRRPLLVHACGQYFIGPDNGILSPIIASDSSSKIIEITEKKYFLPEIGGTFHGRDIFAPVAAWLSRGTSLEEFGKIIKDYKTLSIPECKKKGNTISGEVIYIDKFGNLFTNIEEKHLQGLDIKKIPVIQIKNYTIKGISKFYEEIKTGQIGVLINSFGFLEVFVSSGNAAKVLHAKKGDQVTVKAFLKK